METSCMRETIRFSLVLPKDFDDRERRKALANARYDNVVEYMYVLEQPELCAFLRRSRLSMVLFEGKLTVYSRYDVWKIVDVGGRIALYHRNRRPGRALPPVPGYHLQPCTCQTILDCLLYVSRHDEYRENHPDPAVSAPPAPPRPPQRSKKKARKLRNEQKAAARASAVQAVRRLLDELSSDPRGG